VTGPGDESWEVYVVEAGPDILVKSPGHAVALVPDVVHVGGGGRLQLSLGAALVTEDDRAADVTRVGVGVADV
jgi:hypothetical protein